MTIAGKCLLLGMGSPILSDDGVGLFVARALKGRIPGLLVSETHVTGLGLLDLIDGTEKLFLADAMIREESEPGEVLIFPPSTGTLHLASSHGMDFADLLEMGRNAMLDMPREVTVYGITISTPVAFGATRHSKTSSKSPNSSVVNKSSRKGGRASEWIVPPPSLMTRRSFS